MINLKNAELELAQAIINSYDSKVYIAIPETKKGSCQDCVFLDTNKYCQLDELDIEVSCAKSKAIFTELDICE